MYVQRDYANHDADGNRKLSRTAGGTYVVNHARPTLAVLRIRDDLEVVSRDRIAPAEETEQPASSRTTPPCLGLSPDASDRRKPRSELSVTPAPNDRGVLRV